MEVIVWSLPGIMSNLVQKKLSYPEGSNWLQEDESGCLGGVVDPGSFSGIAARSSWHRVTRELFLFHMYR